MKIGIIGPVDSIEKILSLKEEFNHISFKCYVTNCLKEAEKQFEACQEECDGILFTGCSVFDFISQRNKIHKPNKFIPHNESSLFSLILKEKGLNLKNISVDIINENIVLDTFKEMEIKNCNVLSFTPGFTENDYIEFHEKNIREQAVNTVLTSFQSIYNYFRDKDILVYRLYTTKFSIRNTINALVNDIKNKEIDLAKISVQIVKLDFKENLITVFDTLEKTLEFQKNLVPYLKVIQGAIFNRNNSEFIIFSTKGALQNKEANMNFFKVLSKSNFNVFSGIGIGKTASEAEFNAVEALKSSINYKKSSLFMMDEEKKIIGPMNDISSLKIINEISTVKLEEIEIKTELSKRYINKLFSLMELYKTNVFSAEELAKHLGISNKSSRRILKKIIDSNYGKILKKEVKLKSGRPKNIVEINFN